MNMKLITKHLSRDKVCSLAFIFLTLSIRGRKKKYAKICFNLDTRHLGLQSNTPKNQTGNFKICMNLDIHTYSFMYCL